MVFEADPEALPKENPPVLGAEVEGAAVEVWPKEKVPVLGFEEAAAVAPVEPKLNPLVVDADVEVDGAAAGAEGVNEKPENGFFAAGASGSSVDLFSAAEAVSGAVAAGAAAGLKENPEKGDAAGAVDVAGAAGLPNEKDEVDVEEGVEDEAPNAKPAKGDGFGAVSAAGAGVC